MKTQIKISITALFMFMIAGTLTMMQSCKKPINQVPGVVTGYDNSKKVTASLSGIVLDESGNPIGNANVSASGNNTTTDANGYFNFNNISIPQHNTTVRVSKATYFTGFKSLAIKASQRHTIRLALMKKDSPETFASSNGGTVSFAGGLSITFPANGVVNKQTGAAYSGQVYVYAKTIDPTTSLGLMTMPGDLRGLDAANGEEKILQSFGMLVAELYDQNGVALQIASNSKATISLDIPASLVGSAKASIPMWSFDETKEIWVEEGSATKTGNKYVGDVKHFSYWNYDAQLPSVNFDLTVQDQNGNPIAGNYVSIHNASNAGGHGYTNSTGWVGGLIEANATLTLTVYSSNQFCAGGLPVYTQTVTTGTSTLSLGTIVVTVTPVSTLTGTVIDCANNPVANGSVLINGNTVVNTNASGQFNLNLPCTPSAPITIIPYDNAAGFNGNASSPITLVAGANNLGNFAACGNITPFITISMTNTVLNTTINETYTAPTAYIYASADITNVLSYVAMNDSLSGGTGQGKHLGLTGSNFTVGTHSITAFNVGGIVNPSWTDTQFTLSTVATNSVTYTSFPLAPGQVLGSYSVTLIGVPSGHTYTATGTFRAQQ